ncbi:MAG TPA: hypothetical protein VK675_01020 [Candidatus Paceibacterota bacterium]|nr:hypothetical protein [Candidatus Paceibacterota bacterium]
MKSKSWGNYLLDLYGIYLILIFIISNFQFWNAIVRGSYPLILLLKYRPESVIYIDINFGLYGISLLCIFIQAVVIYYIGNILEKLFTKS